MAGVERRPQRAWNQTPPYVTMAPPTAVAAPRRREGPASLGARRTRPAHRAIEDLLWGSGTASLPVLSPLDMSFSFAGDVRSSADGSLPTRGPSPFPATTIAAVQPLRFLLHLGWTRPKKST